MNTKLGVIIGVMALVGIGLYYGFGKNPRIPHETSNSTDKRSPSAETSLNDEEDIKERTRYVAYTKIVFDAASDKKRVLFFHAPWCPTCRPADAAFQKDAAMIPENVVLFKTDYDTSSELKKKYGVTYQHTFVQVDAEGNEITKWNGGQLSEFIANIK